MNVCVISGLLESNAIARGKKTKALVFTVITKQRGNGNGGEEEQELVSYVPCVIFNPPADLEQQLTTAGKGMHVELQGRLNAARHEANEEPRSNGECVVYTRSLKVSRLA
jgi:single-stranded DNA-binding protein